MARANLVAFVFGVGGLFASVASGACGGPIGAEAKTPQKVATATLFFSTVEIANGRVFPSPLVRASVNGKPTILIVDTGAQVSVVDAHLATEASLEVIAGGQALDPSGSAVAMAKTAAPHLAVEGIGALANRLTAVIALPYVLTQIGIGGILSPQMIPKDGRFVVLDLARRELRLDDGAAAASVSKSVFDLGAITVCRYDDKAFGAVSLVAVAMIDGVATRVELDTGAATTFVVNQSEVGKKLAARAEGGTGHAMGAGGEIDIAKVPNVAVTIGEVDASGPLMMMPGSRSGPCNYEGRIGIDHLRTCTFVIGETSARATCAAPAF